MSTSDLARFELLALRLYVHGPEAAERRAVRALARSPLALETRNLLRSYFTSSEIAELMGEVHPLGCACWKCVIALRRAVVRSQEDRRRRKPRRRPLVESARKRSGK